MNPGWRHPTVRAGEPAKGYGKKVVMIIIYKNQDALVSASNTIFWGIIKKELIGNVTWKPFKKKKR